MVRYYASNRSITNVVSCRRPFLIFDRRSLPCCDGSSSSFWPPRRGSVSPGPRRHRSSSAASAGRGIVQAVRPDREVAGPRDAQGHGRSRSPQAAQVPARRRRAHEVEDRSGGAPEAAGQSESLPADVRPTRRYGGDISRWAGMRLKRPSATSKKPGLPENEGQHIVAVAAGCPPTRRG